MKNLIVIIGLILSLQAFPQDIPTEPSWKATLRSILVKIGAENLSHKILGQPPIQEELVEMPMIPKLEKHNTDLSTYSKKVKSPTAFDQLPLEKKRQYDFNFLKELFFVTRKTEAKDEDLANWMNTLDQGGSREGIYQALVLDDVYATMEAMEEKPSSPLINFYIKTSEKFVAQKLQSDAISQLNLYSLKRILTEKGLDIMEVYESKDLDSLYRWYANFSSDMAKDFSVYLNSDVRKNNSVKFHYEWAKSMPIQHIKSEFIIKLHTVMNELQKAQ